MTDEHIHLHARALEASAVVPRDTLDALFNMVCMAQLEGWTFAQLHEEFQRLIGSAGVPDLDLTFEALAGHVIAQDDAWRGLADVLAFLREKNASLGGDDRGLAQLCAGMVAQLFGSIPVGVEETS